MAISLKGLISVSDESTCVTRVILCAKEGNTRMGEDWDVMFARPRPLTRQGKGKVGGGGGGVPTDVSN